MCKTTFSGNDDVQSGKNSPNFQLSEDLDAFNFTLKMEAGDVRESGKNCINNFKTEGNKP